MALIQRHCVLHHVKLDQPRPVGTTHREEPDLTMSGTAAFPYFRAGDSVDEVAHKLDRAHSTVSTYLVQFIHHEKITDPSAWVDWETIERVSAAAGQVGDERLKPIFDALDETTPYDQIKLVVACLRNQREPCPS